MIRVLWLYWILLEFLMVYIRCMPRWFSLRFIKRKMARPVDSLSLSLFCPVLLWSFCWWLSKAQVNITCLDRGPPFERTWKEQKVPLTSPSCFAHRPPKPVTHTKHKKNTKGKAENYSFRFLLNGKPLSFPLCPDPSVCQLCDLTILIDHLIATKLDFKAWEPICESAASKGLEELGLGSSSTSILVEEGSDDDDGMSDVAIVFLGIFVGLLLGWISMWFAYGCLCFLTFLFFWESESRRA